MRVVKLLAKMALIAYLAVMTWMFAALARAPMPDLGKDEKGLHITFGITAIMCPLMIAAVLSTMWKRKSREAWPAPRAKAQ